MTEVINGQGGFYPVPKEFLLYPPAPTKLTGPEQDMMVWVRQWGTERNIDGLSGLAQGILVDGMRRIVEQNVQEGGNNEWLLGWAGVEAMRLRDEALRTHADREVRLLPDGRLHVLPLGGAAVPAVITA
jgi:hypothetical protein